jgi:hypothetical protein
MHELPTHPYIYSPTYPHALVHSSTYPLIHSVVIMMLQYFVPLAVITLTNSHIGYIVWIKKTPGEAEEDRDRRMAASKRRVSSPVYMFKQGSQTPTPSRAEQF